MKKNQIYYKIKKISVISVKTETEPNYFGYFGSVTEIIRFRFGFHNIYNSVFGYFGFNRITEPKIECSPLACVSII